MNESDESRQTRESDTLTAVERLVPRLVFVLVAVLVVVSVLHSLLRKWRPS